ncbi:MAG: DNA polymerase I [gamma proteobacterium symbiont of Bathyaustriella thionipta]|nr:DNA polymerase I [gamma proteobacterium symbiont of Bathyaustriella thionipta]MCU7949206.1 DNA polymerase I [gamma proteobacterium symbiont of Bathyaustriella thionipta]MCU7954898.1 DNA polymerase I [gamma proteobacterium symbiont of Bathyaustriella thionipta]MCU7955773.1 DNA polymerase I [gamma proteobacterium symbiont of Bathyaustriella thionipta]MCU7966008.1 DNA polymerase I [gamma proteobacterium symbiont of Bathyaustriella thionipta]
MPGIAKTNEHSVSDKQLVLVDGSSYLYRAFHAMPGLNNSKGMPTGAVYGVVNMLKRLRNDYPTQRVAMIFDAKGKTFRDDMFPEYKANRESMPDDLRCQIEPLHEVIRAMGFPLIAIPGVEADDVIGTLAVQAAQNGLDVIISTGDKDMAQLVNEQVSLVDTMKNQVMNIEGVKKKFGVTPEQIKDYLALIGDTSDNIPGVAKVGPKTAVKWLDEYDSVANIIEHAEQFKGKVGENLRASLEQLQLSYQLVTIKLDVEMPETVEQLCLSEQDSEKLKALYGELEFKTWLSQLLTQEFAGTQQDLLGDDNAQTELADSHQINQKGDYSTITDWETFHLWEKQLQQAELIAFDTETTSLDYMQAEIVGVSFAVASGQAAYIPLTHKDVEAPTQLDRNEVLTRLRPLLEDPNKPKVGQNLKYDRNVLLNHDINLQGIAFDTMLESYVLDSTATRHNMDALALKYLSYQTTKYEDIAGKGVKQLRFDEVPVAQAAPYAAEDADITLRLHETLWPKLAEQAGLKALFQEVELPLLTVLSHIERNGVLVDAALLQQQSHEIALKLKAIETQAFEMAEEPFNMSSPKQIQHILFEKMALPVKSKTPKGQPSTAESVLQELALDYPMPKLILEHRSLAKLKSTYTDKLPLQIDAKSGRVHTSYNQAVAVTGRLSSTEPNLQNIPIRTEQGRKIRQAFIAPQGKKIVAADYSQIELRIMAHLSEDAGLLNAFAQGLDVHKSTAAEVFAVDLESVSTEQRRSAKAINFGLIYGMSAFGLAKQLDIGRKDAQGYIDLYFTRYPGVKDYMDRMRELAKEQGYVETVFGRRLYIPEINSRNGQRRQYAERTAINAPMQGSAADIIKRAMFAMDQWLESEAVSGQKFDGIKMTMQVHDELVFEVPESVLDEAVEKIKRIMSDAAQLKVPLIVEAGIGDNWDEAH